MPALIPQTSEGPNSSLTRRQANCLGGIIRFRLEICGRERGKLCKNGAKMVNRPHKAYGGFSVAEKWFLGAENG